LQKNLTELGDTLKKDKLRLRDMTTSSAKRIESLGNEVDGLAKKLNTKEDSFVAMSSKTGTTEW
jgi:predicted  nucleic acid-binding Zn-ribbon protein